MPLPHPFVSGIMTQKWYKDPVNLGEYYKSVGLVEEVVPSPEKRGKLLATLLGHKPSEDEWLYCFKIDNLISVIFTTYYKEKADEISIRQRKELQQNLQEVFIACIGLKVCDLTDFKGEKGDLPAVALFLQVLENIYNKESIEQKTIMHFLFWMLNVLGRAPEEESKEDLSELEARRIAKAKLFFDYFFVLGYFRCIDNVDQHLPVLIEKIQLLTDRVFETFSVDLGVWNTQALDLSHQDAQTLEAYVERIFISSRYLSKRDCRELYVISEEEEKGEEDAKGSIKIKNRMEFYSLITKFLEQDLITRDYVIPFEVDHPSLYFQLKEFYKEILNNPHSLFRIMQKDPAVWFILPTEFKTDVNFVLQYVKFLNQSFQYQGPTYGEGIMEAIWTLIKLNPDLLGNFISGQMDPDHLRWFDKAWWNRQMRDCQTTAKKYSSLRRATKPFENFFPPLHEFFSLHYLNGSDPLWINRPREYRSKQDITVVMEQMKAVDALMRSDRLNREQVIEYAQKINPDLLSVILKHRKALGLDPLGCYERAVEQFTEGLLPLLDDPLKNREQVPAGLSRELQKMKELDDFNNYWNNRSLERKKEHAQARLMLVDPNNPLTPEQRRALEQFTRAPNWPSAYFEYQLRSPYSAFEDWDQVLQQLLDSVKQLACLVYTMALLSFRLLMLPLLASLFFLHLTLVFVYFFWPFLLLVYLLFSESLLPVFVSMSLVWWAGLLDYRHYSDFVEVILPVISFVVFLGSSGLGIVLFLIDVVHVTSLFWPTLLAIALISCMDVLPEKLEGILRHWRGGDVDRTSFWDYCYRVIAPMPALLFFAFMCDSLVFGMYFMPGLLASAFLVRAFSSVEEFYRLVTLVPSENFYIPWFKNALVAYALESWKIAQTTEWNILFPWFSRTYETLTRQVPEPCEVQSEVPEPGLDLAEMSDEALAALCEQILVKLSSLEHAQKQAKLLKALWKCIKEEGLPKEAAEAPEILPTPSSLRDLLKKQYLVEAYDCEVSFLQVVYSQGGFLEILNSEPKVKSASWGFRFFDTVRRTFGYDNGEQNACEAAACSV